MPLTTSQRDFATILSKSPDGILYAAALRTQPLGGRRAPASCGRVARFAQFVIERVFAVAMFVFVDDCFVIEPRPKCAAALESPRAVCELLGLASEQKKEIAPRTGIFLLGAHARLIVSIHLGSVSAEREEGRSHTRAAGSPYEQQPTACRGGKNPGGIGICSSPHFWGDGSGDAGPVHGQTILTAGAPG